jgi:hypothetical protein
MRDAQQLQLPGNNLIGKVLGATGDAKRLVFEGKLL